jgi:hypothetical protein
MTTVIWFMLFGKITAAYSENDTKSIDALYGQNAELLNIKAGGTYIYHCFRKLIHP